MSPLRAAFVAAPFLTKEREAELATAWQKRGDVKARDALVGAFGRLASKYADHIGRRTGYTDDLLQEALLGIMRAADLFDPSKGFRFSTYADRWIRSNIQTWLYEHSTLVPLPASAPKRTLFAQLRAMQCDIERKRPDGNLPGEIALELAERFDVAVSEVEAVYWRVNGRVAVSFGASLGPDMKGTVGDTLPAADESPEDLVAEAEERAMMRSRFRSALSTLTKRERRIIRARRLCEKGDELALHELGAELGVSKERVRQIEYVALEKLRKALGGSFVPRRRNKPRRAHHRSPAAA